MKLIKPFFDIIEQPPGLEGIYKIIEIAGRTCYKSESKITNDSAADKFVEMLIKRNHTAMLEHGTVYLSFHAYACDTLFERYYENPYSTIKSGGGLWNLVTTNYRVLVENDWLEDLQYQCEPTEFHEKRLSVRFTLDRGISHEFVRHRVFSFAQESTRYCNYSKDSFGNELTFIIPDWCNIPEISIESFGKIDWRKLDGFEQPYDSWYKAIMACELNYFTLLNQGWTPQQARSILPNSLKTELVMTGTVSQWKGFFKLRCDSAAHPQARELAEPLEQEMIKLNLL